MTALKLQTNASCRAFTLIEILVVVIILGILAAIVVPQFSNASDESKETALKQNLFRMRQQIEFYNQQHGSYPTLTNFIDQMTLATDLSGNSATPGTAGHHLGPYLQRIPLNPYTDTVPIGDGVAGTSAWYYDQTTGHIAPNDSTERRAW